MAFQSISEDISVIYRRITQFLFYPQIPSDANYVVSTYQSVM